MWTQPAAAGAVLGTLLIAGSMTATSTAAYAGDGRKAWTRNPQGVELFDSQLRPGQWNHAVAKAVLNGRQGRGLKLHFGQRVVDGQLVQVNLRRRARRQYVPLNSGRRIVVLENTYDTDAPLDSGETMGIVYTRNVRDLRLTSRRINTGGRPFRLGRLTVGRTVVGSRLLAVRLADPKQSGVVVVAPHDLGSGRPDMSRAREIHLVRTAPRR